MMVKNNYHEVDTISSNPIISILKKDTKKCLHFAKALVLPKSIIPLINSDITSLPMVLGQTQTQMISERQNIVFNPT